MGSSTLESRDSVVDYHAFTQGVRGRQHLVLFSRTEHIQIRPHRRTYSTGGISVQEGGRVVHHVVPNVSLHVHRVLDGGGATGFDSHSLIAADIDYPGARLHAAQIVSVD